MPRILQGALERVAARTSGRARRSAILLAAAIVVAVTASPAGSNPTVLDFEELADGAVLGTRYEAKGVVFDNTTASQVKSGVVPAGSKVVRCAMGKGDCAAPVSMKFADGIDFVQLRVGYLGRIPPDEVREVLLRAFDRDGKEIGKASAPFNASSTNRVDRQLVVNPEGMNAIRSAEVSLGGTGALVGIAVDDISFYRQFFGSVATAYAGSPSATLAPTDRNFGVVAVDRPSQPADVTLTNDSDFTLTVTSVTLGGANPSEFEIVDRCSKQVLDRAGACSVTVTFRPKAQGVRAATLVFASNAPTSPDTVALSGTGATVRAAPTAQLEPGPVDFGEATVREGSSTRSIVLTNTGGVPLQVKGASIAPTTNDFSIPGNACSGQPLPPGQSCPFTVRFAPLAQGVVEAALVVLSNAKGPPLTTELRGTGTAAGVGTLRPLPDRLDFGPVESGATATLPVMVTNDGTAPVEISGAVVADSGGPFGVSGDACSPRVLQPKSGCTVVVRFRPESARAFAATLAITGSATGRPRLVPLKGSGSATPVPGRPGSIVLEARPASAQPGDALRVAGSGFVGETVLVWSSDEQLVLAKVVPDATGSFTIDLVVPLAAPAGPHHVIACDMRASCGEAPVAVELDSGPDPPEPTWWKPALLVGLVALLGAVSAVVTSFRRRRSGAPPDPPGPERPGPPPGDHERDVRTGFTRGADYRDPLDPREPLEPGQAYHFWVELGPGTPGDAAARLAVALFPFDAEIAVELGQDLGEVELRADGSCGVVRQGGFHVVARTVDGLLGGRLFFPVRTSVGKPRQRLRCSIYHANTLVQSWLITADVGYVGDRAQGQGADPQARERDFVLSRSLGPDQLTGMAPHALSLLLNGDGDTHELRLFGEGGFKASSSFGGHELVEHLTNIRKTLRRVVCGVEEDGAAPGPYRYEHARDLSRLAGDLADLAREGYRTYDAMIGRLAADVPTTGLESGDERLQVLLRRPARIQVVNQESALEAVPAVTFYDRPLDDASGDLELCHAFVRALQERTPLTGTACFLGECPTYGQLTVVCPSGFWGFRHHLGLPQSIRNRTGGPLDVPLSPSVDAPAIAAMAVSTDPDLQLRRAHEDAVRRLPSGLEWLYAASRDETVALLRSAQPRLVYFYCHGGMKRNLTYLAVGSASDLPLTPSNIRAFDIKWKQSRPLVFVNGCQTTAIGPNTPLNLVTAFVERGWAAGVIGTEVTVFEPLACAFAEDLLERLLVRGERVGDAVRDARLTLLEGWNPLGLVYVPYVMDELRLVPETTGEGMRARGGRFGSEHEEVRT